MSNATQTTKTYRCTVVSDKMNKSRVGQIVHLIKHKTAGKYIKRTSKLMFHDEKNESKIGDQVLVKQVRPLSSRKSFALVSIEKVDETFHS